MKRFLLFVISAFSCFNLFSQAGKHPKPSGVIKTEWRKVKEEPAYPNNSKVADNPSRIIKKNTNSGNKIASSNRFTGSMNAFGYLISQSKPLQYNKGVDAISFVARKDGTYTASSNSNSGTIVGLWSTNLGLTWDETCIWANSSDLARYPNGGLYNPLGNSNINNAWFVGSGPLTNGTSWTGNWFASKQITSPGNTTPGLDQQAHLDASPTIKKHAFARYGFTTVDGGIARSMATVVNDINATNNVSYGLRGAAMVKGMFSAGAFVWSVDSFIPPVNLKPSDGTKLLHDVPIQAWDDAGVVGYVVMIGSRAGTNAAMRGYQPIVYKTTNSGASWSLLPAEDFADPVRYRGVYERTYPVNSNTNVICANFRGSEGFDCTVDFFGQLHLTSMVYGHYSNDLDSLDYRYTFGSEQYSYAETGPFEYPMIYDFYTSTSGGWFYTVIDSMGTEGPSGTSGQPGYGTNPWTDGSSAKMDLDARLQISRTADGRKIFYSWTESDSTVVGSKWNIYPDINMKGYDVTNAKYTPRFNLTVGDANLVNTAFFHYMCNKAIGASTACITMPFTSTKNSSINGGINVDTYYLDGVQVCPTSFSINLMTTMCTSVGEISYKSSLEIKTFPNPTHDATSLVIGLQKTMDFEIIIYNSIGQKLENYKVNGKEGSNEVNLDLRSYNSGLYLITIVTDSFTETKKIIKE